MGPGETFILLPIFIFFGVIAILLVAFWIWMLVDCATNNYLQGNDKVVWVLVVVLVGWLGAIIYFFIARQAIARQKHYRDDGERW